MCDDLIDEEWFLEEMFLLDEDDEDEDEDDDWMDIL